MFSCFHDLMFSMQGEIQIIRGLQQVFDGQAGQAIIYFCARWMIFVFVVLAAATGLWKRAKSLRYAAYEAAWSALLAFILSLTVSYTIGRTRPFLMSPDVGLLIPPPGTPFSFPSSHASVAFAMAFALAYGHPALGFVALLVAVLVAFGRVAAGVHYPSDVIAGIFVGLIAFIIARHGHKIWRAFLSRRMKWHEKLFKRNRLG
ncbi:phosphatase PAP2 family protein [Candidatus Uhrbacteria bacterium]|nr:phosphatase PAP2 family protein [Candidatus Uhrbacteria bacterium]